MPGHGERRVVVIVLSMLAATLFAAAPAARSDGWPEWRGPRRAARHAGLDAPAAWPAELTRVWRVEVGAGLSSPVVAGGRVFLLTRAGDEELVRGFDLEDGSLVWRRSYLSRFFANGGAIRPRLYPVSQGKGPFATPVVHGDRLLTLGVDRVLSAFAAADGRPLWRRHYLPVELPAEVKYYCRPCGCDHDGHAFDEPGNCPSCGMGLNPEGLETSARGGGGNYYGAAASPLVSGDLGVVHVGNLTEGLVIAFDHSTGEERWRWSGPTVAYSSPVAATLHGEPQVVTMTRTAVVGLELATGRLLWSFEIENDAHQATPVLKDDLVILSRYRGPTFALRISRQGDSWSAEPAWENAELTQWLTTPVLDGDRLYGFFLSKKGQFATLDAATGETLWAGEGRQGESAAVVLAGDHLLALKDDGSLVVLAKRGAALETVASYAVADSPTWAYPALVGSSVLVKDERFLTLWRIEEEG
ncbi:MAG: PQQ-binding-like beta-propeller repeat protein [Thermoanaerobaculia bacterium]|nr:PQQ-binding-like beta-propeller repeat protein [Thermoanaerobaculia bacterium]